MCCGSPGAASVEIFIVPGSMCGPLKVDAVVKFLRLRMTAFFNSGHPQITYWRAEEGRSRLERDCLPDLGASTLISRSRALSGFSLLSPESLAQ